MRILWLPEVLRDAGLKVHEVSGWKTRGSASWGPVRGVTCHATAGARGGSTSGEIGVLLNGSPSAPPPIAQLYLARNGDYHVVASGKCFHNLIGWAGPNKGYGNDSLIGIEAGNDNRGEPWPAAQLDAYRRGVAAICRHLGLPASRVAGHYEHQPGSKSDPLGITMTTFRRQVADLIEEDDVAAEDVWRHRWTKVHLPGQETSAEGAVRWIHKHVSDSVGREEKILATQAAILAAVTGQDTVEAVREELDRHRSEIDEALQQAATERAEILTLITAAVSGERDAADVVDEIARRLATDDDASA